MSSQKVRISLISIIIVVLVQFSYIAGSYAQTTDYSHKDREAKGTANTRVVEVQWHEILPGQEIRDIRTGKTTRVWTTRGPVARYRNRDIRDNLDDFDSLNIEIDSAATNGHKIEMD